MASTYLYVWVGGPGGGLAWKSGYIANSAYAEAEVGAELGKNKHDQKLSSNELHKLKL